jgi:hypothetical protein
VVIYIDENDDDDAKKIFKDLLKKLKCKKQGEFDGELHHGTAMRAGDAKLLLELGLNIMTMSKKDLRFLRQMGELKTEQAAKLAGLFIDMLGAAAPGGKLKLIKNALKAGKTVKAYAELYRLREQVEKAIEERKKK